MSDENSRCLATTKAGTQCKNKAQDGSVYCHVHAHLAAPEEVSEEPVLEQVMVEEEPVVANGRFQTVVKELNQIAGKLQQQAPNFVPPPFSPTELLNLLKKNVDRFTPEVVNDLRSALEGATAEDFKDPETWKGMWFILTYTAKEESKSLLDKATNKVSNLPGVSQGMNILSSMPGAGLVSDLSGMFEGASPKDFLDKDTWTGMWYIINHSLRHEAGEMKKRILRTEEEQDDSA